MRREGLLNQTEKSRPADVVQLVFLETRQRALYVLLLHSPGSRNETHVGELNKAQVIALCVGRAGRQVLTCQTGLAAFTQDWQVPPLIQGLVPLPPAPRAPVRYFPQRTAGCKTANGGISIYQVPNKWSGLMHFPGQRQAGFMEHTGTKSRQGKAGAPEQGRAASAAEDALTDGEASNSQNRPPSSPAGAKTLKIVCHRFLASL